MCGKIDIYVITLAINTKNLDNIYFINFQSFIKPMIKLVKWGGGHGGVRMGLKGVQTKMPTTIYIDQYFRPSVCPYICLGRNVIFSASIYLIFFVKIPLIRRNVRWSCTSRKTLCLDRSKRMDAKEGRECFP